MRFCQPPDRCATGVSASSPASSSSLERASATRASCSHSASAAARGTAERRASRTVTPGANDGVWGKYPVRSPVRRATLPPSGDTAPARILRMVDFPAPLGPISPTRSPSDSVNPTSSNRGLAENVWVRPDAVSRMGTTLVYQQPGFQAAAKNVMSRLSMSLLMSPSLPIRGLVWALSLQMVGLAGCSREGPAAAGGAVAGQPEGEQLHEIGSFDVRLVAATAMPPVPAQTAVFGGVFSGPAVSRLRWRKTAEAGGCGLFQPEAPFCDPPCDGRICADQGTSGNARCVAEPSLRNAGTVRLEGLRGGDGKESPIQLLEIQSRYQLPLGLALAYPPFAPGAAVKLSGVGGEVGAFSVSGKGVSPLQVQTADPITVESGKSIELRWTPPAAGEATVVQVSLDLSVHGGTKGKIECQVRRQRVAPDGREPRDAADGAGHGRVPLGGPGPDLDRQHGPARGKDRAEPDVGGTARNRDPRSGLVRAGRRLSHRSGLPGESSLRP